LFYNNYSIGLFFVLVIISASLSFFVYIIEAKKFGFNIDHMMNETLITDVTQGASKLCKISQNSTDFIGGYSCLTHSGLKLTPTG
jgi:hypothetical protein